ncbi:MAG: hypothetical protein CME64_05460 [Halobacteriovoraceae bacterium]|nr:hypothetical protein [Halobacteriovoraceae bacterium]
MDNFYSILIDIVVLGFFGLLYYTWQKGRIIKASKAQIKAEISDLIYELHEYLDGKEQTSEYQELNSFALALEKCTEQEEFGPMERCLSSSPNQLPARFRADISKIKALF